MTAETSTNASPTTAWTQDLLDGIGRMHAAPEIFGVIERAARLLGFEHCAYGVRTPAPFSNPRFVLLSNYDAAWRERYLSANYLASDPTVRHGMRSLVPVVWSNELFHSTPQMWDEARSFGLRVGWAQSCFDGSGHVGMLSLARAHDALTPAELNAHEAYLRCLANVAHMAIADALREDRGDATPVLTAREAEVARWMADGKTSGEVGDILRVSEHTANFHLRNVIMKLQAANRTAAVARAIVLGLLS
jgi:DNA-binding CsgD family transcriptional regulator